MLKFVFPRQKFLSYLSRDLLSAITKNRPCCAHFLLIYRLWCHPFLILRLARLSGKQAYFPGILQFPGWLGRNLSPAWLALGENCMLKIGDTREFPGFINNMFLELDTLPCYCSPLHSLPETMLGTIHKWRHPNFGGFGPPSPLVTLFWLIIVLNPCNLPYYVCIWGNPLPPPSASVGPVTQSCSFCVAPIAWGSTSSTQIRYS